MYFVNMFGGPLDFAFQGTRYRINAWEHVDLPEELCALSESNLPQLEVDYHRYIAEAEAYHGWATLTIHLSTS